jgi:hypothetical protein
VRKAVEEIDALVEELTALLGSQQHEAVAA